MDHFCVITNREKDTDKNVARRIQEFLTAQGRSCMILGRLKGRSEGYTDASQIPANVECCICVGGDGTLIQAAIDLIQRNIPLVGVNLGTLGFLTEVDISGLEHALLRLVHDDCTILHRMMLYGHVWKAGKSAYSNYGLNDIVLARSGRSSLISVRVSLNDRLIDTYIGDGVIVCTPTGSTGYNLSAGGPIIEPEMDAITITPICPHSLNKRTLVVSPDSVITLELGGWKDDTTTAMVAFDGKEKDMLEFGDRVVLRRARESTSVVKLTDMSFFDIMRSKLGG